MIASYRVASLRGREGRTGPGDTIHGVTPEWKKIVSAFRKNTGQTTSEMTRRQLKKSSLCRGWWLKRSSVFFSGKKTLTPSVAAPGDTNPSDATDRINAPSNAKFSGHVFISRLSGQGQGHGTSHPATPYVTAVTSSPFQSFRVSWYDATCLHPRAETSGRAGGGRGLEIADPQRADWPGVNFRTADKPCNDWACWFRVCLRLQASK